MSINTLKEVDNAPLFKYGTAFSDFLPKNTVLKKESLHPIPSGLGSALSRVGPG